MKALPSAVSCASQEFAVDMSWPAGWLTFICDAWHCLTWKLHEWWWVWWVSPRRKSKSFQSHRCFIAAWSSSFELIYCDSIAVVVSISHFRFPAWMPTLPISARPWQFFQSNSWSLQMLPPHEFRWALEVCAFEEPTVRCGEIMILDKPMLDTFRSAAINHPAY